MNTVRPGRLAASTVPPCARPTAAFAMGPDRALARAARRPGVEALAVLPDGTRRWTPGLPRHLPPTGPADWRPAAPAARAGPFVRQLAFER
ncbi:hypothetical protein [Kitasatospora sp. NPDC098663]|uniref:hypothetical protein n=1 Tax=Kitasatospora sp. NPDC098663 TaxID=3364096 RepID=UPI00381F474F